jgi:hypothetical protein
VSRRIFSREIVVAASLVGAVVVVVGYASGFGVRPIFGDRPAPGAGQAIATRPPAPRTTAPVTTTTPPGQPAPANPAVPRQVVPGTPLPRVTSTTSTTHPHPSQPTTPPPPTTSPPPACQPGLVSGVLDTLLSTVGSVTGAIGLPLPVSALPALPVDPAGTPLPLDALLGTCPPEPGS